MKRIALAHRPVLAVATILVLVVAGCGRDSVKVYKADASDSAVTPPPASTPAMMPAAMPGGLAAPDNSGLPKLKYVLPDGWKEKPLTQMRVASFDVSGNGQTADVSVIPLGGMSGGDLANVNRWRGQVGQPPITEDELAKLTESVDIAGKSSGLYDLAGTKPDSGAAERILGGILHSDSSVWYFKMSGDADWVESQKTNFVAFLKSVSFDSTAAPAAPDMSQLPPSHPPIAGMSLGPQNSSVPNASTTVMGGSNSDSAAKPTWTVPADWKEGPLAQFLVAKFIIPGSGDATASVNVSSLAGDGGGLQPNVNRWRGQLGQTPLSADDLSNLPTIDASGVKGTLVDISGTDPRSSQPARLIGVVLPLNGQTWFYKLMGDATVVAQQKAALIQFVQSAKYPAGQ